MRQAARGVLHARQQSFDHAACCQTCVPPATCSPTDLSWLIVTDMSPRKEVGGNAHAVADLLEDWLLLNKVSKDQVMGTIHPPESKAVVMCCVKCSSAVGKGVERHRWMANKIVRLRLALVRPPIQGGPLAHISSGMHICICICSVAAIAAATSNSTATCRRIQQRTCAPTQAAEAHKQPLDKSKATQGQHVTLKHASIVTTLVRVQMSRSTDSLFC